MDGETVNDNGRFYAFVSVKGSPILVEALNPIILKRKLKGLVQSEKDLQVLKVVKGQSYLSFNSKKRLYEWVCS